MSSLNELLKSVKFCKNRYIKSIMYRLINIYKNECRFNEGDLGFDDLVCIFNNLNVMLYVERESGDIFG